MTVKLMTKFHSNVNSGIFDLSGDHSHDAYARTYAYAQAQTNTI